MTTTIDTKNLANTVYHAAVLSALTVGFGMAAQKLIKSNIGDPSKANLTEAVKLTAAVSLAIVSKGFLEKYGLPQTVMNR